VVSCSKDGTGFHRLTGTSMATALASGVVACIRTNEDLSPAETIKLLFAAAEKNVVKGDLKGCANRLLRLPASRASDDSSS
jgi:hypothetical protein